MAAKSNEYSNYLTPQVIRVLKTLQPGEMEPRQQRRRSEPNQVTPLPDNDTFLQDTHAFFFQHFPSPEEIAKIMSPEIFAAVMLAQVSHLIWKKTPSVEDDFKEVYELEKQKKSGRVLAV